MWIESKSVYMVSRRLHGVLVGQLANGDKRRCLGEPAAIRSRGEIGDRGAAVSQREAHHPSNEVAGTRTGNGDVPYRELIPSFGIDDHGDSKGVLRREDDDVSDEGQETRGDEDEPVGSIDEQCLHANRQHGKGEAGHGREEPDQGES
jgi:hypothetical protein